MTLAEENAELKRRLTEMENPANATRNRSFSEFPEEDENLYKIFPMLPPGEHVLDWYSCALSRKILAHGWLYVTANYLCFNCNLLVYQTTEIIEVKSILEMQRKRHMRINQGFLINYKDSNGATKTVELYSFLDTDKTIHLIESLRSNLQGMEVAEFGSDSEGDEEEDYVEDVESKPKEGEKAAKDVLPIAPVGPTDTPYKQPMETADFTCSTEDIFMLLLAESSNYFMAHKESIRCLEAVVTEIEVGSWTPGEDGTGAMRTLCYRFPLNVTGAPPSTMIREVQRCRYDKASSQLLLDTSCQSLDVPYGSYFSIENRLHFTPTGDGKSCHCEITMQTKFSRSTMLEWKINSNAIASTRESWIDWCAYAKTYIAQAKSGAGNLGGKKGKKGRKPSVDDLASGIPATPMPSMAAAADLKDPAASEMTLAVIASSLIMMLLFLLIRVESQLSAAEVLVGL